VIVFRLGSSILILSHFPEEIVIHSSSLDLPDDLSLCSDLRSPVLSEAIPGLS